MKRMIVNAPLIVGCVIVATLLIISCDTIVPSECLKLCAPLAVVRYREGDRASWCQCAGDAGTGGQAGKVLQQ